MYTSSDLPELPMKTHELLTSAEMWCQESPAKDAHGNKLEANDPRAAKWCALGAIQKLYPPSQRSELMDQVLRAFSVSEGRISQLTATDKACCERAEALNCTLGQLF
jgi:hypothetical protein